MPDIKFIAHVPADGSCLYYSIVLAYLLPSLHDESEFVRRCLPLFEEEVDIAALRGELRGYDGSATYIQESALIPNLIEKNFRKKLIKYMRTNQQVYQKMFNDFHELPEPISPEQFSEYLDHQSTPRSYVGKSEVHALIEMLGIKLIIHNPGVEPEQIDSGGYGDKVVIEIVYSNYAGGAGAASNSSEDRDGYPDHYDFFIEERFLANRHFETAAFVDNPDFGSNAVTNPLELDKETLQITRAIFDEAPFDLVDISGLDILPYSKLVKIYKDVLETNLYDGTVYPYEHSRFGDENSYPKFNSLDLIDRYGGANCVGMSLKLQQCLLDAFVTLNWSVKVYLVASTLPNSMKQAGFPEYCHVALVIKCKEKFDEFLVLFDPAFYFDKPVPIEKDKPVRVLGSGKRSWVFSWDGGERIRATVSEGGEEYYYLLQRILNPDEAISAPISSSSRKFHVVAPIPEDKGFEHVIFDLEKRRIRVKFINSAITPGSVEGLEQGPLMEAVFKLCNAASVTCPDRHKIQLLILELLTVTGFDTDFEKVKQVTEPVIELLSWYTSLARNPRKFKTESIIENLADYLYRIVSVFSLEINKEEIKEILELFKQFSVDSLGQLFAAYQAKTSHDGPEEFVSYLHSQAEGVYNSIAEELGITDKYQLYDDYRLITAEQEVESAPRLLNFDIHAIEVNALKDLLAALQNQDPDVFKSMIDDYQYLDEDGYMAIIQELYPGYTDESDETKQTINFESNLEIHIAMQILQCPILVVYPDGMITNIQKLQLFPDKEPIILYYDDTFLGIYLSNNCRPARELMEELIKRCEGSSDEIIPLGSDPALAIRNLYAQMLPMGIVVSSTLHGEQLGMELREHVTDMLRWMPGDRTDPPSLRVSLRNRELYIPFERYRMDPGVLNQFLVRETRILHRVMENQHAFFNQVNQLLRRRRRRSEDKDDPRDLFPRAKNLLNRI